MPRLKELTLLVVVESEGQKYEERQYEDQLYLLDYLPKDNEVE